MDSHEAAHHLLGVLRASGVGETDERAVDSDPGAPFELEHKKNSDKSEREKIYRPKTVITLKKEA